MAHREPQRTMFNALGRRYRALNRGPTVSICVPARTVTRAPTTAQTLRSLHISCPCALSPSHPRSFRSSHPHNFASTAPTPMPNPNKVTERLFQSPSKYIQGPSAIQNAGKYLSAFGKAPLLLSDELVYGIGQYRPALRLIAHLILPHSRQGPHHLPRGLRLQSNPRYLRRRGLAGGGRPHQRPRQGQLRRLHRRPRRRQDHRHRQGHRRRRRPPGRRPAHHRLHRRALLCPLRHLQAERRVRVLPLLLPEPAHRPRRHLRRRQGPCPLPRRRHWRCPRHQPRGPLRA